MHRKWAILLQIPSTDQSAAPPCFITSALLKRLETIVTCVVGLVTITRTGFDNKKLKNAASSCIIYPAIDKAVLLVSMRSLLACLTLLGITCAFRFPTRKDGKGCYQPSFDKGIKEVVWVNNFWCVLLSRFPSVSLVRGVPFLKQTDQTV